MRTYEGNLNDLYPVLFEEVMNEGERTSSRNGGTYELNPAAFTLPDPRQRLVTAEGRPLNVAFALAEVLWILQGRRDLEMLKAYNASIAQWSDDGLNFNAPYGYRMREAHGFDQILDVILTLKDSPDSRQAVINIWHPSNDRGWVWDDRAHGPVKHQTADRACNIASMMKIRNGALNWTQVMRSNDLIWGTPYNVMQFTHLQEYIARSVGAEVGTYTHLADSLHVYDFNRPITPVWKFDLYHHTAHEHEPMKVEEETMLKLRGIESTLRTQPNLSRTQAIDLIWDHMRDLGKYWTGVVMILAAHRFYRDRQDYDAIRILMDPADPVYSLVQAKFYWVNRWSKSGIFEGECRTLINQVGATPASREAIQNWFFQ